MKVIFIVPYPLNCAPSQRLKFEQYLPYLKSKGISYAFRPFMSEAFYRIVYKRGRYIRKIIYTLCGYVKRIFDLVGIINYDIVYIHLEATPLGPPVFEYLVKFLNKPITYDIDDIVFLPNYSPANRFLRYIDNPKKTLDIFKISNHIIVVTNYLKTCALKYNKNVTMFPPTIDTDKYYVKQDYHKNSQLCIGWSGSRTTSAYLKLLESVLKIISKKYPVKIKVIGDADFKIEGLSNLCSQEWRLQSEVEDMQEIDIGLYPLPNTEWVLGKGGLKALQYMGLGIPVVCSDVGACKEFIRNNVNGFLVDSPEEWIDKISLLIESADLRKRIGLAGRKTVEDGFSVKANAPKFLKIIESANNKRGSC